MDVLLLLVLHSINAHQSRRAAEQVVKMKAKAGLMQEALIQKTFRNYAQVSQTHRKKRATKQELKVI